MTRIRAALGAALALVLLVQPFATEAQHAGKVWRIGLISVAYLRIEDVFFQHLKGLGYVEGHNLVLGMKLQSREARGPSDFERVLAEMTRERPDALLLIGDRLTLQHGAEIVDFATQKRIPSMLDRAYLETAGALLSYGAEEEELWRRAADLADKILKGAKPADLPIEQPTKFKFVINLKTAKTLGLTIPQSVFLRADEVIQ